MLYINKPCQTFFFFFSVFLISFIHKMHSIPRPPSHSKSGEIIIDYENESYQHQTQEFMKHLPAYTKKYIIGLFPIASWLHRYNLQVTSATAVY